MELNQAFTQRTRLAQAPQPSQIKVDHRSLAQLLALSSDYGHLFKFYSLDNSIDGDWEPMFAADPAIAYATRLGLDTHAVEVRMYEMIDTLIDPRTHSLNLQVIDGLHSLVARMLTILSGRPWTAASAAELYAEAAMLPALTAAATPLASFFNLFPPEKLANPDLISHSGDQLNRLLDLLRSFCGLLVDCLDSAQVDAQQGLSRELNQSGHAPHVALFIAFVMMYQKVQNRLNQFPADLLEFYHQTVLRQAEFSGRLPIPDRVVLTFRPQADIPIASVPVSAEFVAGNDAAGNPIIYTPDLPIDAKNVNLVRLQSLRMFASATANSPTGTPVRRSLSQVLTTDFGLPLSNSPGLPSQPLFPVRQPSGAPQPQSQPAAFGFGCASPLLQLRGGVRRVTLNLDLLLPAATSGLAATTDSTSLPLLLATLLQQNFGCAISDGEALRARPFTVSLPSPPPNLAAGVICVSLHLELEASAPAWTSNQELHPWPLLLFRLKPDAMVSSQAVAAENAVTAYTWLSQLELHGLSLAVDVQNQSGLPIVTPLGRADPSAPIPLFGSPACRGASFTLLTAELAGQAIDSLSIQIDWHNLPVNSRGFSDYYQAYVIDSQGRQNPPGSLFSNSSFQVDLHTVTSADSGQLPATAAVRLPLFASAQALEPISCLNLTSLQGKKNICALRVVLSEPINGFGESLYQANIMEASIALSSLYRGTNETAASAPAADPGHSAVGALWPNQPWQPQAASISLSYQSSTQLRLDSVQADPGSISFLQIGPFTSLQPVVATNAAATMLLPSPLESAWQPDRQAPPPATAPDSPPQSLPQAPGPTRLDADAALILDWSEPINQLDLLIGLVSAATLQPEPRPLWIDIWCDGFWRPLPASAFQDGSSGLTSAGILRLQLPDTQSCSRMRLLTILADQPIPELMCIEPNAVWVTWQGPAGADRLDHCLPAGTITTCRSALSGINSIYQPLPSVGGMPADGQSLQQVRFTERLSHQGVAIQPDDYAKILLDEFPTLWQVAVLPATDAEGLPSPGSVALVPIPGPKAPTVPDPTAPVCDGSFRLRIAQVLSSKISPFVKLSIVDPHYCRITVKAEVIVANSVSTATALQQLQLDLVSFLSPWPLADSDFPRPNAYYEEINIGHFIRERPSIQAIEKLELAYSPDLETSQKSAFLYFTSALQHQLVACLPQLATR
jgi:hypothetical protein